MAQDNAVEEIATHAQRARDQIAALDRLGVRNGTQVYISFNAFADRGDRVERMSAALGDCSCRISVAYPEEVQREIWGEIKRPPTYHLFGQTSNFGYAPSLVLDWILRMVAVAEECSCDFSADWSINTQ